MKVSFDNNNSIGGWCEFPLLVIESKELLKGTEEELLLTVDIWLKGLFGKNNFVVYNGLKEYPDKIIELLGLWAENRKGDFIFGISAKPDIPEIYFIEICFDDKTEYSFFFENILDFEPDTIIDMPLFQSRGATFKVNFHNP